MLCTKCNEEIREVKDKILYKVTTRECISVYGWDGEPKTLHTGYDENEALLIYHESAGEDYAQRATPSSYRMTRLEYIDKSEDVIKMIENSHLRTIAFPDRKGILL